jgi:hypothetical protein
MMTSATITPVLASDSSIFPNAACLESIKKTISSKWNWCVKVLNKHTDLVSSIGILSVTTCLLGEKIFQNFPQMVPRLGRVFLNYTGIISLNVQIRDCQKSWQDLVRTLRDSDAYGVIQTGAKVFVKGMNVLLTSIFFSASAAALWGFPQVALGIYLAARPFALTSLAVGIFGDAWDYYANEEILFHLQRMEHQEVPSRHIATFMKSYFEIILDKRKQPVPGCPQEAGKYSLASRLVRQLDYQTIQSFQENSGAISRDSIRQEAVRRFGAVKDSLLNRQSWTKSNLTLLALGYLSMGICRAYPDTLIEMTARWSMSVLYTDELIRYKLFQADIAAHL